MKLLVISAAFPPMRAGEADHAMHLCHHLAERGLDVHVLTTKRDLQTTGRPFALHPIMPNWRWSDLPRLARFLRRCAPDAILFIYSDRDYNSHPMMTFAPSISKYLLPSVPFVTQLETEHISRDVSIATRAILKVLARLGGPQNLDYVYGTLLRKSDRVIVLSERHLTALSKQFGKLNGKGMVVPPPPLLRMCSEKNGAARKRGREALGVKPDEFLVAYFGYIYPEKGIETLLKAFRIVNNRNHNVRLIVIGGCAGEAHGSSYIDSVRRLAKDLGIADNITWSGEYTWESDKASLYLRAADACVFPFNYGVTLNRSSLAAAATHGLPIVTTKGTALESPFVDQENVLLCPPEDPNSIALAIGSLISNQDLRQRLRIGALKLASEYFSWDKALDQTIEALVR